jgi:hypothetical protein
MSPVRRDQDKLKRFYPPKGRRTPIPDRQTKKSPRINSLGGCVSRALHLKPWEPVIVVAVSLSDFRLPRWFLTVLENLPNRSTGVAPSSFRLPSAKIKPSITHCYGRL